MEPIVQYKAIRNGYARINAEGNLEISIPRFLKHDEKFKENLIQRGKKLQENYQKKEKIQTVNEGWTTLFGEPISISDIIAIPSSSGLPPKKSHQTSFSSSKKLKEELKTILAEYARPLMDHYSALLGKSYKELNIRKTSSKR